MGVPLNRIPDRARSVTRWRERALAPGRRVVAAVEVWRGTKAHRTTGHAAEMAFFAVLTLVPSTIAVGSALGLSKHDRRRRARCRRPRRPRATRCASSWGPELADDVITPFVHAQLTQPHRDVALGALLIAWWLSSHLFMATGHALDDCYGVRDHRPTFVQRCIALAFALGSVAVVAVTVEMMVSGPLGDADRRSGADARDRGRLQRGVVGAALADRARARRRVPHLPLSLQRQRAPLAGATACPGRSSGAVLWISAAVVFRLTARRARLERGRQQRPVGRR